MLVNSHIADAQLVDLQLVDPQLVDPQLVDLQLVDSQLVDPQLVDPQLSFPARPQPHSCYSSENKFRGNISLWSKTHSYLGSNRSSDLFRI